VTKRQLADELHGQVEEVIGSTESGIIEKLLEVLLWVDISSDWDFPAMFDLVGGFNPSEKY
jgi:hypothetical protein